MARNCGTPFGRMKTKIFGEHDEATIAQIERCVEAGGERAVLCADGHKGYAQPIGCVVAYTDKISLSGVGFDIACGNLAIRTDATRAQVAPAMEEIMNEVVRDISFGIGQKSKTRIDHELFDDPAWELLPMRDLKQTAALQLGTVGGGNHYVDIFADEDNRIWVGVHFGSRGLGHKTATHFLKAAGGKDGMDVPPTGGDDAVIIEGVDSGTSREALFSTVHGAGRIMSRTAAKGKFVKVAGKRIRKDGLVRHDEMMKWIADKGVVLRGGDLDEAPQAYRRLPNVLAAHAGTIRILHTLTPLGVAMAGRDTVDPYKD